MRILRRLFILAILTTPMLCRGQGTITTIAGNGTASFSGDGGPATSAGLGGPQGVAVDGNGNVYIADLLDYRVRKVNSAGIISTAAGCDPFTFSCSTAGLDDGGPATAGFMAPFDVGVDNAGNFYIADDGNNRIRKVNAAGILTTVAGGGNSGLGDGGPATSAVLNGPIGIAVDNAGNVYFADLGNNRIRKVNTAGVITTVAGNGTYGFSGDGGPATSAMLAHSHGVAVDSAGNLYITDSENFRVRKVNAGGTISTIAGSGMVGFSGDGGAATSANMTAPWGVTLDGAGNIYFADWLNNRIRKVTPPGIITTIASGGSSGLGDGGPATSATLFAPTGVALDSSGNLYIADDLNNLVRKVTGVANGGGGGGSPAITLVANAEGESPTIAPNTWIEIKGSNLAPAGDIRIWGTPDFVNNQMPTALDGVSVKVNGQSAYVYYISPTQVNVLTPPFAMTGPVQVQVQVTNGGFTSAPFTAQAQALSPSFFVFNGGPYVAAEHADYSFIGPASLYPGLTTPAKPGETVALYANGFGTTSVPVAPGSTTQSGNLSPFPVVAIGGMPATVAYAALVAPGEYLLIVVVPALLTDGDHPLSVSYGGSITQPGVLITTQH